MGKAGRGGEVLQMTRNVPTTRGFLKRIGGDTNKFSSFIHFPSYKNKQTCASSPSSPPSCWPSAWVSVVLE